MALTEIFVRAAFPALMSSRFGRSLPGRLGPRLGRRVLAALKAANQEELVRAEQRGDERIAAYPGFVTVAGTSRCNVRCEFCVNQWDAAPDGSDRPHMDRALVERIAAEVFPYARKVALSVSGEPLFDPNFALLIESARKYDVFVEFTTNGMLLSKPGIRDLVLEQVGRVNVSIDGATAETYERLRQGSRFDRVCQNVRALVEARERTGRGPEVNVRFILMRDTIDELPRMVDLCADLRVDHLYTNHLQVFREALVDQSLLRHPERTRRAMRLARERASARGLVVVLPEEGPTLDAGIAEVPSDGAMPGSPTSAETAHAGRDPTTPPDERPAPAQAGQHHPPPDSSSAEPPPGDRAPLDESAYSGRCSYLWDQAFFEADGKVFPCCNSSLALGDLGSGRDFFSIWNDEGFARMRRDVYTARCHEVCVHCYLRDGQPASEVAYIRPV